MKYITQMKGCEVGERHHEPKKAKKIVKQMILVSASHQICFWSKSTAGNVEWVYNDNYPTAYCAQIWWIYTYINGVGCFC